MRPGSLCTALYGGDGGGGGFKLLFIWIDATGMGAGWGTLWRGSMCIVTPLVTLCMLFRLIGKLVNVCPGKGYLVMQFHCRIIYF